MARITRFPGLRHYRGTPTAFVVHLVRGELAHSGVGQAFYYRPRSSALSEIPADDRELPVLFHARTSDFQDVAVQAGVTYHFADPVTASRRLDFGVDPDTGAGLATGPEQLVHVVTELAQSLVVDAVAAMPLASALGNGVGPIREALAEGLARDERLAGIGVAILGARVLAISPAAEVERALQTPAREAIQAEADRATYERRALAVERERQVAENELANKIELAARAESLLAQEGANDSLKASQTAASEAIAAEAAAERQLVAARASAEATRLAGDAEAAATAALMRAYDGVEAGTLLALALRAVAENLPEIGAVTITPDLLTGALAKLGAR